MLAKQFKFKVSGEDVLAYIAAVTADSSYLQRFKADLVQPGLRIPLTRNPERFRETVELGREVVWLHTFGERFADAAKGRPLSPPRLPKGVAPRVPADGAIPTDAERMPDEMAYDESTGTLRVGHGRIERVTRAMWEYEVSGKHVLTHWFSYRKKDRRRPMMGDRRPPSELGKIQPDGWPAEYTTELLNVLHVLGRLIELEPKQAALLNKICAGKLIDADAVRAAVGSKVKIKKNLNVEREDTLFGH